MHRLILLAALVPSVAAATPRRLAVPTPSEAFTAPAASVSRTIYLERCKGGCDVTGGTTNDAVNLISTIPNPGFYRLSEFENTAHQTGTAADAEWAMIVQCMREVYSPFAVEVTDVKPAAGPYHLALIAGDPPEVGLDFSILGVAPLGGECQAFDNVISFSFANNHNQTEVENRVLNICWTAAQESAHAFGLDHEFEFVKDGRSACNDPMTYRIDCGGQKFYRNFFARCGEDEARSCRCGSSQNSHKKLLSVFGPGTPITAPPAITMTNPLPTDTALPANVIGQASSQRGIAKVALFMNGSPYLEVAGMPFGPIGQPESAYGLLVPANAPDSIYDVFLRAYDDLGAFTDSQTVTVTKGTPCTTADTCLPEQRCDGGRCLWDPPSGELGDACTYPQFCKSNLCRGTADVSICTQLCEPEDPDGCPANMECNHGVCFFASGGGCCSASGDGWMPAAYLAALTALIAGRKRRRKLNTQ